MMRNYKAIGRMLPFVVTLISLATTHAADPGTAKVFYRGLERHLQTLKSLEIHYRASGAAPEGAVSGQMIFVKPDRFYHDTPEWTMCELGTEQWRYLKEQQTVILERAETREWLPETLLLNLGRDLKPAELMVGTDGIRTLTLRSDDPSAPAEVELDFGAGENIPAVIRYTFDDGSNVEYVLEKWIENSAPDPRLFEAPTVAPENRIDFRVNRP